jgi:hypothetical protein
MSRFCCFSMRNTNPTEADQSDCPYFGKVGFVDLYSSGDGKEYCALHLPISNDSADVQYQIPKQSVLFHHILQISRRGTEGKVDLRKTHWRSTFEFSLIAREIGANLVKCIDFTGSTFAQALSWHSVNSVDRVVFDAVHFLSDSRFHEASQDISFKGAKFDGHHWNESPKRSVNYSNCMFSEMVKFNGASESAQDAIYNFKNSKFLRQSEINFSSRNNLKILFEGSLAENGISIIRSGNSGSAELDLSSASISTKLFISGHYNSISIRDLTCDDLTLEGYIQERLDAQRVTCRGATRFSGSCAGTADFSMSNLMGDITFLNFKFDSHAVFKECWFGGLCKFDDAIFHAIGDYSKARFGRGASWAGKADMPHLVFDRACFRSSARFTNREFSGPLSCRQTVFAIAPDFHGCKFHQDTSFKDALFLDDKNPEAAAAYRTLKLAMESARAKDEEALFYALEQRSWRRNMKGGPMTWAFSWLYDLGSNYGRSIGKPIIWLAASFIFFALLYSKDFKSSELCLPVNVQQLSESEIVARYQLTQLVRPFDALTFRNAEGAERAKCVVPFRLAVISAGQTTIQLSLIALLFLAIRRRFKME